MDENLEAVLDSTTQKEIGIIQYSKIWKNIASRFSELGVELEPFGKNDHEPKTGFQTYIKELQDECKDAPYGEGSFVNHVRIWEKVKSIEDYIPEEASEPEKNKVLITAYNLMFKNIFGNKNIGVTRNSYVGYKMHVRM